MGRVGRRGGRLTEPTPPDAYGIGAAPIAPAVRAAALASALAHPEIDRLAKRLHARTAENAVPAAESRLAAVAAVLRVVANEPELLFIKRAILERDPWSGHVAFPGGRIEPGDDTLQHTAVRETREELALDLTAGVMLGRLDDLAPRTRALPPIIVRPFVAVVHPEVAFEPSREVAATFWVPLSILRDPSTQAEHVMTINGVRARFPAYRVDEHLVWGLTERIVRQLLSLFDP
jgi:8-oxo-dGTP pyrophosphatase MutT (NUDIX family)